MKFAPPVNTFPGIISFVFGALAHDTWRPTTHGRSAWRGPHRTHREGGEHEYEGNMVATGSVEISPSGRVDGNIETNSLVISKGGFFNGNVVKLKETEEGKPAVHLLKEKLLAQAQ